MPFADTADPSARSISATRVGSSGTKSRLRLAGSEQRSDLDVGRDARALFCLTQREVAESIRHDVTEHNADQPDECQAEQPERDQERWSCTSPH
jgi:hypothetical protein